MSATDYDIAICGAGPVGLCLAALLARHGMAPARIALIDARTLQQAERDPRSIALSHGSRQILETVGAWPLPATPIEQIHVSRRGHFGRTLIDRADHGVPALGYVGRYGALVAALAAAAERAGVHALRPLRIVASHEDETAVTLELDGRPELPRLTAPIVVQAEGGVFSDQGARARHHDYRQVAIVAEVTVEAPQPRRAFERFTDEGPLALLPQQEAPAPAGNYALVWCMRPDSAERLMPLTDAEFLQQLGAAFGTRLGRMTGIGRRNAYPLGLNAQPAVTARTVAIGNAAQTLHPVAGQGLNLGLRDAAVLARLLAPPAAPDALHAFVATRRADRGLTIRITDAMARVFASAPDGALSQTLLGFGLGTLDLLAPARKLLAEQMMYGHR